MSTSLFDLNGRMALITGASQGIGFSLALGLGRAGAKIVLKWTR
jgi:gluconate 5-dehydrogenase